MFKDKLLTSITTDTQMLVRSLFKLFPCCNPQKWCMSRKNISCNLKLVPTAIVLLHVLSFVNIWERLQDRRSPPSAFPQAHPSGCGSIYAVLQWLAGDTEHGHMWDLTSSSVGRSALSLCLIGVYLLWAACVLEHWGWVTKATGSSSAHRRSSVDVS